VLYQFYTNFSKDASDPISSRFITCRKIPMNAHQQYIFLHMFNISMIHPVREVGSIYQIEDLHVYIKSKERIAYRLHREYSYMVANFDRQNFFLCQSVVASCHLQACLRVLRQTRFTAKLLNIFRRYEFSGFSGFRFFAGRLLVVLHSPSLWRWERVQVQKSGYL
jgi:hypothetical protein